MKIKKNAAKHCLELIPNPDILADFARDKKKHQLAIGFAAETEQVTDHAYDKLQQKSLDLIVANDVSNPEYGFGSDYNMVHIIDRDKETHTVTDSKRNIGRVIVQHIVRLREHKQS